MSEMGYKKITIWWISLISHWNNEEKSNLFSEVNIFRENQIPHEEIIIFNKTMCAPPIIGTPAFNTLHNLPLPIKQHRVFSRNI